MTLMAFLVAAGIGLSYFLFLFFLQFFFTGKVAFENMHRRDFLTVFILFLVCGGITYLTLFVPDKEIGNRLLHMVAGGLLTSVTCFLAARRSGIALTQFQLFSLIFFFVTMLGVGNEIAEFIVHETTTVRLAYTIIDTWLDLVSNSIGIGLALLLFYFIPFRNEKS